MAMTGTSVATSLPPRMPLASLPTPITAAPRLAAALHTGPLQVKRDDLSGFAFGGSKVRNLEFLLSKACQQRDTVLVTGGGPASNFCAAAAAAAAHAGMACHLLLAGDEPPGAWHPNLAAARAWGATLHWTHNTDRTSVDAALDPLAERLATAGHRPSVLPRGGATGLGSVGAAAAALELHTQWRDPPGAGTPLVLAVGSGGTLAGLLVGNALLGRPWHPMGVSVSRPPEAAAARVHQLATECAELLDAPPIDTSEVILADGRGPGHGIPSDRGRHATRTALTTAGIVLDPVYTAKALAAVPELTSPARPVLFWHTGGLPDAFAALTPEQTP
jgi:1-aminocyclopropane-1-carboxylate deaminase/D-cysteine desulfhydrase-like pyridoxal-dependent ACC family enzyme